MTPTRDPEAAFRAAGLPFTVQRRVIHEVLAERPDHPTADRVFEEVEQRLPGISRTTVYRTLEALVRVGLATRIAHPGAAARYDPKTERHHHLICDACGGVTDLEDEALDALALPDVADGFHVRGFSVQVTGVCATCAASAG